MDLFNTFCLFDMNSPDWCAKLKECRDSDGKRFKSSSMIAGEEGPEASECNIVMDVERERLRDGLREAGFEGPIVPLRGG